MSLLGLGGSSSGMRDAREASMSHAWVRTSEAAEALGVSRKTVVTWIHQGHLRASRLPSGHYRIAVAELRRLQKKTKEEGEPHHE